MLPDRSVGLFIIIHNVHFIQQSQIFYLDIQIHQLTERQAYTHYSQIDVRAFPVISLGPRAKDYYFHHIGMLAEHAANILTVSSLSPYISEQCIHLQSQPFFMFASSRP